MKITVSDLSKSYGGRPVLAHINACLEGNVVYCLMGPSGSGKTTFFRLLLGLEQPDSGVITGMNDGRIAAVFQEDRLCDEFTPVENVAMVLSGRGSALKESAEKELARLLPEKSLNQPVSTLSGGMKRRTAIVRALATGAETVLMDEPFTGLDRETKKAVIAYIREKAAGRLVVISTHQEEDVKLLGGALLHLTGGGEEKGSRLQTERP